MINCLECKKLTTNPKFCSQSCSATHNNKKNPRKLKKYYCKKCGILLCEGWKQQKNKWLCSKCNPNFKDWNNITLKDFKDGRSIYKAHARLRALARLQYKKSNKTKHCQHCNWSHHYEICHIKPIKDFNDNDTVGMINHPDNLIALCPNCHWLFDHQVPISGVAPDH